MYIVPLVILLVLLVFLVEVFAIAMKMTGLDIEKARFQVLTLLTSTGFTTRESELIVQHPVRRRIAKIIMIMGYIATATIVSIIFRTLLDFSERIHRQDLVYVLLSACIVVATLMLGRNKRFITVLDHFIEYRMLSTLRSNKKKSVEEVLKLNEEFGVAEMVIDENSPLVGVTLKESGLKQNNIQVLNIEGATHMIHFPQKDNIFEIGDKVVVYGNLNNIKKIMDKNNG